VGQAADELRQDIEQTRDDLAVTVDAIGEKVSPKLQAERQMERLRQSGVEPRKAAMIGGAAVAVLLLLRRRRHRHDD
jgi:hypothetical protein